jgi:chromosome segregation ATPase
MYASGREWWTMEQRTLEGRVGRLEESMEQLEKLPDRMVAVEGRLTSVEGRLGSVEGRLGLVEGRLGSVEGRLGSVEGRLGSVELQIVQLRTDMNSEFSALRNGIRQEFRGSAELMDLRFVQQTQENDETKAEMRKLNMETMAQARMLYEDLKETIKKIGEGPGEKPN